MCSVIRHRGPEGAGFAQVGHGAALLGHVRLSIIDLPGGAQPMFNEDHSVAVVFNGEIYDYQAHRDALARAGHTFRTRSDTEVIVHLYEEHGPAFLERLNGEFAIVVYDDRTRRLLAARDRFGVKPLFFSVHGHELLLASEAKSILALDRVSRSLSPDYLVGTHLGAFPYGGSAFAGITADTQWMNTTMGIAMGVGRFFLIIPTLAIAGSLARKQPVPEGPGTFPTHTPLFVALVIGVIFIVGALTFLPALALGPLAEQLGI